MSLADYPFAFYALAIVAVLLTGISKGGFGSGIGGLAVPLLALHLSPVRAAGIMLPILCVMDIVGLLAYRGRWSMPDLRTLMPGAVAGILIGTVAFDRLSPASVRFIVGFVAITFALNHWFGLTARIARSLSAAGATGGFFWGALSGFTSTLAHAGGPPLAMHLLRRGLEKSVFVGTTVVFFTLVNALKIVPYAWLGQFDRDNLLLSAALLPLAPVGMLLGVRLQRRLSDRWFYRISYAALFASGVKLTVDGWIG